MKINGKQLELNTQLVTIKRADGDVEFRLTALPLGFHDSLEEKIPSPVPPLKGFCREKKRMLKDQNGRPIPFYDEQNKDYKRESNVANKRQSALMLHEVLRNADNIEWNSTIQPLLDGEKWIEAADVIYKDFKDSGFSLGDMTRITEAMLEVSNLKKEELDEGIDDFLSGM